MKRILDLEPALIRGFIVAVIAVLTSFGLYVSADESASIIALVFAVLAIAQAVSTRSKVSPSEDTVPLDVHLALNKEKDETLSQALAFIAVLKAFKNIPEK